MSIEKFVAMLYQRIDLIEYAETLLNKIENDTSSSLEYVSELVHVINRLRILRKKLKEELEGIDESEDRETLVSYYVNISSPKELEIIESALDVLKKINGYQVDKEYMENDLAEIKDLINYYGSIKS